MNQLEHCEVFYVVLQALPGRSQNEAIAEGSEFAMRNMVPVIVRHNNKQFTIRPKEVLQGIYRTEEPCP